MVEKEKKENKFENLGRWHNISVTKWINEKGNSYTLQVGYKKAGSWTNKSLSLFPIELDGIKQAIACIENDLVNGSE